MDRCWKCGGLMRTGHSCEVYMSHRTPYKCPVCDGAGKVCRPPWLGGDIEVWEDTSTGTLYTCQACSGTGVVWR